ncbi:MAG: hypothetical protein J1G06_10455 [Oscillospiraceae bacterium]|nr:hypothetical protein [Oscillospiraceae bacterium]
MDENNNNFETGQTNNDKKHGKNAASYGAFNQGGAEQYGQYDGSTDQYGQYDGSVDQYGQYGQGYDQQQYGQYGQGYDQQQYGQYGQGYDQQQYGQYGQGYTGQQYGQYGQYPQPQKKKSRLPMVIIIIICSLGLAAGAGFAAYNIFFSGDSEETTESDSVSKSKDGSEDKDSDKKTEKPTQKAKEEKTPEPTVPPAPVFTSYEASSTRGVDHAAAGDMYYYPSYAIDGDMTTAWSSNRSIELTPTYTLRAETKQHVSGIRMTNGYCKSTETYKRNRRITQVTVSYEGGSKTQSLSTDAYREMQEIRFDIPVDTSYIQIHVDDSIYGDWLDIAISEIEVF